MAGCAALHLSLTRTYHEPTCWPRPTRPLLIYADPPSSSCNHLFPEPGISYINCLVLISFCVARATARQSRLSTSPSVRDWHAPLEARSEQRVRRGGSDTGNSISRLYRAKRRPHDLATAG